MLVLYMLRLKYILRLIKECLRTIHVSELIIRIYVAVMIDDVVVVAWYGNDTALDIKVDGTGFSNCFWISLVKFRLVECYK